MVYMVYTVYMVYMVKEKYLCTTLFYCFVMFMEATHGSIQGLLMSVLSDHSLACSGDQKWCQELNQSYLCASQVP